MMTNRKLPKLPLCECGCGKPVVKKGNRFIRGHSGGRGSKITPKSEPKLCECGCGKLANHGCDYILGHSNRDREFSSEWKDNLSKASSGVPNTLAHNKAISEGKLGTTRPPFSDKWKKASGEGVAKIRKERPEIWDAAREKQRGGYDIVKHHFIYDHNNPKNHTVEITRSQHTGHHNWMRRNGLEVPHVNVTEENKDIFNR